jgi:hypothetical protein
MTTTRVKSYPGLGVAAMRAKEETLYRVWLLARALDVGGSGVVAIRELGVLCESEHVCTREALARVVKIGEGRYWNTGHGGLVYVSLFKLAEMLRAIPGHPVWLDVDLLRSVRVFRAALLQSWVDGRTISRAALRKATGRSASTVGDYLRTRPTRTRAVILDNVLTIGNVWKSARPVVDFDTLRRDDRRWFVTRIRGVETLCQRMPNSYVSQFAQAAWGQVKKYRPSFDRARGARLYFETAKAAARAMQRGAASVYYRSTGNDLALENGASVYRVWRRYESVKDVGYLQC